jgi:transcriptional regulator with XRE-family HTH domain
MNIGQRIREVREDLGMQAAVLARRVEVAPNTIYRIETGDRLPSVGLLEKIARELRTEPAELVREPASPLGGAQPSSANPPDVLEMSAEDLEDLRARARRTDPEGNRLYAALTRAQKAVLDDRMRLVKAAETGRIPYEELAEADERDRRLGRLWGVVLYERQHSYIDDDPRRKPEAPIYPDTTDLPLDDAIERIRSIEQKISSSARAPA